jgi:hypothetical protein
MGVPKGGLKEEKLGEIFFHRNHIVIEICRYSFLHQRGILDMGSGRTKAFTNSVCKFLPKSGKRFHSP